MDAWAGGLFTDPGVLGNADACATCSLQSKKMSSENADQVVFCCSSFFARCSCIRCHRTELVAGHSGSVHIHNGDVVQLEKAFKSLGECMKMISS